GGPRSPKATSSARPECLTWIKRLLWSMRSKRQRTVLYRGLSRAPKCSSARSSPNDRDCQEEARSTRDEPLAESCLNHGHLETSLHPVNRRRWRSAISFGFDVSPVYAQAKTLRSHGRLSERRGPRQLHQRGVRDSRVFQAARSRHPDVESTVTAMLYDSHRALRTSGADCAQ